MSLPAAYLQEIDALNQKVSQTQPADILQFCANHFNGRLEEERSQNISGRTANMTNPFATTSSPFASAGSPFASAGPPFASAGSPFASAGSPFAMASSDPFSGPFGGGGGELISAGFDGTRDAITEEEEDVHSPTTPNFRPQFNMGPMGGGGGGGGSRSSSRHRQHSPSGGGVGPRGPPRSAGSQFLSASSNSHLSPASGPSDFPSNYNRNRRTSVSAESLVPNASNDEWSPPSHPKTAEQMARLKSAVSGNFLFTHLDEDQFSQILLALFEKPIPNKDMRVITQGDVGDFFYIVERGGFDIYVNSNGRMMPGADGMGKKVNSIGPGGSFGELALMYNAPRAATVVSTTAQNILWALDRMTFRRILMENTFKRRRMYETFLEEVALLSPLVSSERSKIADSLDTETYEPGDTIIREGDPGDRFYFIESGVAEVHKSSQQGGYVRTLNKGDYFGELALLNDAPRAASIIAKTKVKVAFLGKAGFQRLLGPVADIMRRNDPRLGEGVDSLAGAPGLDGSVDPIQEAAGRGRPVEV